MTARWAAVIAVLVVVGCSRRGDSGLERVRRTGVLRWGGDMQGGEPYVAEDPEHPGRMIGFEVDLANAIAGRLGVRAEFVHNDWQNLLPALERGTFDVALNGLEVTPARTGRVAFTRPYYVFALRLMARANDPRITGVASVRGMRVGTLANSLAWHVLVEHGANPLAYEGSVEPYDDLEAGRSDAVLLDDIVAMRYAGQRERLHVVADVQTGYYAAATRPVDATLRDAIDHALAESARAGELRRILARWGIDGDRQAVLERWTDEQTQTLLAQHTTARFQAEHVLLFLRAAAVTLGLSVAAMMLAVPFGLLLALLRLYGPRAVGVLAGGYVELFRGTPVLLQLYVLYFGIGKYVQLDAVAAAVLGLGLNYAAYEAEVYRAGVQAVPIGQMEAALALGMNTRTALRRVIVPQAFRMALPGVTNDFIALLKDSSLVSVITVVELTKRTTIVAENTASWLVPGLLCAGLYFAMGYPLSALAQQLEKRLARG